MGYYFVLKIMHFKMPLFLFVKGKNHKGPGLKKAGKHNQGGIFYQGGQGGHTWGGVWDPPRGQLGHISFDLGRGCQYNNFRFSVFTSSTTVILYSIFRRLYNSCILLLSMYGIVVLEDHLDYLQGPSGFCKVLWYTIGPPQKEFQCMNFEFSTSNITVMLYFIFRRLYNTCIVLLSMYGIVVLEDHLDYLQGPMGFYRVIWYTIGPAQTAQALNGWQLSFGHFYLTSFYTNVIILIFLHLIIIIVG